MKWPLMVSLEENIAHWCKVASRTPPGCFVEFGVYRGGSARQFAKVARKQGRKIYLYDTFCGIPLEGPFDCVHIGEFSDTSVEEVRARVPDAIFCVGVFPHSLVDMEPIAFCYVDCDQYQSVKDAGLIFGPLMVKGGVMVFNDAPRLPGADKAVQEVFGSRCELASKDQEIMVRF